MDRGKCGLHTGGRHDGCRIGVEQDNLISFLFQSLHGLGATIVEFAGLSDDNGAAAITRILLYHVLHSYACLLGFQDEPVENPGCVMRAWRCFWVKLDTAYSLVCTEQSFDGVVVCILNHTVAEGGSVSASLA